MVCTVVVVDDHAGFRAVLRRMLERDGFAVVGEAGDGVSALALLSTVHPSVVLLDVGLPGMDGFQVLRRLRAAGNTTAVVLISSRGRLAYEPSLAVADAVGFVRKDDLSPDCLRTIVARQ